MKIKVLIEFEVLINIDGESKWEIKPPMEKDLLILSIV